MANGYLGKISAVVSANTADFQSKLNASAKDVQAFARSVQSNLTSASKEAARSFESIYTPLQKFERSLQAAASMKLSFKGFAGAVKDVDVLRQRLASMKDSQVSLAVRASGMKNITELREALVGLKAKDLDIVAKVGGIEKVRELRALSAEKRVDFTVNLIDSGLGRRLAEAKARVSELKAEVASVKAGGELPSGGVATLAAQYREATAEVTRLQEVGRQAIKTTLGVNVQKDADVDRILQAAERADAIRLPVILDVLGEAAVKEAVTQTQRIRSVAEQINRPFGEATQKLAAMSAEVQAGFLPAMKRSQSQIESLKTNIERSVLPASAIAQQFDVVETRASAAASAVARLAEASSKIGNMKTGQELAFANPQLSETLDRGVAVGAKAASLPAATIQANPRIAEMLGEITALSNKAVAAYAGLQRRVMLGLPTDAAQKSADALQAKLDALFREFDTTYQVHVDAEKAKKDFDDLTAKAEKLRDQTAFVVTGRPQTLEQADSRRAGLDAEVSTLDRSQRQNLKPLLQDADAARALGDLDKVNDALDKVSAEVSKYKKYNVTFEQAKKDARDLKATMDSLKESAEFQFTGLAQNQTQARGQLESTIGKTGSLDPAALSRVSAARDAAITGLGNADFGAPLIKVFSDLVEKELQAKKAADDLKAAMSAIDDAANPSAPIDILKKNLAEARAAVAKLEGPMKAIGEKNIAKIEAFVGANAGNEAAARLAGQKAGQVRDQANAAAPVKPPKVAADPLGADFGTAERQIATIRGSVQSLQSSLEKLPTPMQVQFIPAINKVRAAVQNITTSAPQKDIDALIKKAAGLELALTRAGQASKIGQTLGGSLNEAAIGKVEKQIGFIRSKLLEVGAAASGPVADAFNKYAAAAANAAKSGTAGLPSVQKQLDGLIDKLVQAAVATGTLDAKQAQAFKKSVGDVGRAGADKFALALNQAAFAVDDFLSSTGGLEFKLRAISNNVTQLAFILGGTTGLFVGLGAVIAGQAAVGLVKWINNGRTAEDQTKALNDTLVRQKSLVEELAQAFQSLGDSLSRGTFSASAEQAREFEKQIESIKSKQREVREERTAGLDSDVQRERAQQGSLQKRLEQTTDVGQRLVLEQQIRESKDREKRATEAAISRPPVNSADAAAAIRAAGESLFFVRTQGEETVTERDAAVLGEAAARANAAEAAPNPLELRKTLESQRAALQGSGFAEDPRVAEQIRRLTTLLASLEGPVSRAIDELANEIAAAARGPAEQIRQAQEEVAEAIKLGLPGARLFQRELDRNAEELAASTRKLSQVQSGKDEFGNDLNLSVSDKDRMVKEAQSQIDDLNARRRDMAAQADAFAYERIVDPQRQIDARMGRARGNLSAAGLEDGRIARRMREIEAERETIRQRAALPEFQTPEMIRGLQDAEEALNEEAAAIEAATSAIKIFADALNKASEEVEGNLNSAQQAADEARRADLANSTPQTREARRQAEADLEAQRQIERKAREEIAVERDRLEQMNQPEQARLEQINEQLMGGGGTPQEREALIREREDIRARMEDQARASQGRIDEIRDSSTREEEQRMAGARGRELTRTPEERFAAETDQGLADIQAYFERRAEANGGLRPAGDAAAQAAAEDRFRKDREKEARTATAAGRGRELAMTDRERFRRDMEEGVVADLTAAAKESNDPAALLRQGIKNQMESVAPMLQQFAEERQNAILQGPSRAALNVSDVSTTQGASELTRLLRGDDSAKDVNLAELQKQTQKFDDLIAAVKAANPGVLL